MVACISRFPYATSGSTHQVGLRTPWNSRYQTERPPRNGPMQRHLTACKFRQLGNRRVFLRFVAFSDFDWGNDHKDRDVTYSQT